MWSYQRTAGRIVWRLPLQSGLCLIHSHLVQVSRWKSLVGDHLHYGIVWWRPEVWNDHPHLNNKHTITSSWCPIGCLKWGVGGWTLTGRGTACRCQRSPSDWLRWYSPCEVCGIDPGRMWRRTIHTSMKTWKRYNDVLIDTFQLKSKDTVKFQQNFAGRLSIFNCLMIFEAQLTTPSNQAAFGWNAT